MMEGVRKVWDGCWVGYFAAMRNGHYGDFCSHMLKDLQYNTVNKEAVENKTLPCFDL